MGGQTRRAFLKTIGLAVASAGCSSMGQTGAGRIRPGGPNIIFILADDLGYGDLGCYGQKQIKTPNIDKMAAQGMRFTDHYAGSTVCAPSRCVLMTGLHTGHCYVRGNKSVGQGELPLPAGTVTVAKILKQAGYQTGVIGKWGLGGPDSSGAPNSQGFDYFFGYLSQVRAHNYYPTYLWRNQQKVKLDNEVVFAEKGYAKGLGSAATVRVQYSHDLFTEEALAFVQRNRSNPFFLYLTYTIPHANNEARLLNRHGMEVPTQAGKPDYGIYKDKDWPEPQKGHAAMITRMDRDIGRLFAKLAELGLDEDTLVMFSSDNGPHKEGGADPAFFRSSGPLRGYKRDLYEGGIRVPFIARWPGNSCLRRNDVTPAKAGVKAGSVSSHVSAFWDFLPTCCELVRLSGRAEIKTPEGLDGISMVPTLLGKAAEQKKHEYLYWEFHEQGKKQAVRMGDWKGVRLNVAKNPAGPIELYNLRTDIAEEHNVADQHPQIAARIADYMKVAHRPCEFWSLGG